MVEIKEIESGSIAADLGIRPGARLISINGEPVNDMLDYRFYCSGENLEVLIGQDGEQIIFEIEKDVQEDLGLVLEDLKMRHCGNKCVFCFVHQNPSGLRKSLYFKDEDYRFSFLYGHYVTLTNTGQDDLNRIVEQRLTPLYISVHVTDLEKRKYMLGIKTDDQLLEKIRFLTDHGIELHCQIVLCPGLNDGKYLERTIADLKAFYPGVKSVAIVPVGLTKHRRGLPALNPVTEVYSRRFIKEMDEERLRLKEELGSSFVYLSDEFYLRTGTPIPDNDYYEGFYQLENGVGLTRDYLSRFEEERPLLEKMPRPLHLTLVSGVLGATVLERYFLLHLKQVEGLQVSLRRVVNRFFGETVEVAGLLVGQDIYAALKGSELGDYIVLPPRVLNHDGLFLDDWQVDDLEQKLGKQVFIFPESFVKLFENIAAQAEADDEETARRIRHFRPVGQVSEPTEWEEGWKE